MTRVMDPLATSGSVEVSRRVPMRFQQYLLNSEFCSAVLKAENSTVCRKCLACPSRHQGRTREKSVSWASLGSRLRCSNTRLRWSQFCMCRTSHESTMTISIEDKKSESPFDDLWFILPACSAFCCFRSLASSDSPITRLRPSGDATMMSDL